MKNNAVVTVLFVTVIFAVVLAGGYYVQNAIGGNSNGELELVDIVSVGNKPHKLSVTAGKPVVNRKMQVYSVNVSIKDLPLGAEAAFYLCNANDTVAKSLNGEFVNVPGIDGGKYELVIRWRDASGAEGAVFKGAVVGFMPIEKEKIAKMEAATLQRLINNRDNSLLMAKPQIRRNVRITFTNIKQDERYPQTFDEVFNKLRFGQWTSVQVVALKYNDDNEITDITLSISHK